VLSAIRYRKKTSRNASVSVSTFERWVSMTNNCARQTSSPIPISDSVNGPT
jgi:hypothetical protein